MVDNPTIVALIPARAGSKRVPAKNTRMLGEKPLLAWTILAAKESKICNKIAVASDDRKCELITEEYGANEVEFIRRPRVSDGQPDIIWIRHALAVLADYDAFAILRPTSPFRTAMTIQRAWEEFLGNQPCDSLRAVELVKRHPAKMWSLTPSRRLEPILRGSTNLAPWHSSPTQILPNVYVQNASLEIAWCKTVTKQGTIAGSNVVPFFTHDYEGFNIDTKEDFIEAERVVREGLHADSSIGL